VKHNISLNLEVHAFGHNSFSQALEEAQKFCDGMSEIWKLADNPPKLTIDYTNMKHP
jgi:hypothetical protein